MEVQYVLMYVLYVHTPSLFYQHFFSDIFQISLQELLWHTSCPPKTRNRMINHYWQNFICPSCWNLYLSGPHMTPSTPAKKKILLFPVNTSRLPLPICLADQIFLGVLLWWMRVKPSALKHSTFSIPSRKRLCVSLITQLSQQKF